MKTVIRRMTYLKKKNCSIHYAIDDWMIIMKDGKARGHQMFNEKITEINRLIIPTSQMTKAEAIKIINKTKKGNE